MTSENVDSAVLLVKEIIDNLVDDPSKVKVEIIQSESMLLIEVRAGTETGKILGKQGTLATAIRTILKAIGAKEKKRYEFAVLQGNSRSRGNESRG